MKASQAHVSMNSIKIPKPLRNVMSSLSKAGKVLHVQTVVTRRLARKTNLDMKAGDDFLLVILRKSLNHDYLKPTDEKRTPSFIWREPFATMLSLRQSSYGADERT